MLAASPTPVQGGGDPSEQLAELDDETVGLPLVRRGVCPLQCLQQLGAGGGRDRHASRADY